jgi:hypothetical protein
MKGEFSYSPHPPSSEISSCSAIQKIPYTLSKLQFRYHDEKDRPCKYNVTSFAVEKPINITYFSV